MPSKKKKYNARFPAGRIKKIMQTDEEVGKVAQAVPVIISRTLELFVESLLTKSMQITLARNAKTLTPSHMKQCILSEHRFDFLKDLVKDIPDASVQEDNENNAIFEDDLRDNTEKEPEIPSHSRRKQSSETSVKETLRMKIEGDSQAGHSRKRSASSNVLPSIGPSAGSYSEQGTSTSRTPVIRYGPNITQTESTKMKFSVSSMAGQQKNDSVLYIDEDDDDDDAVPSSSSKPTSTVTSKLVISDDVPPLIPISHKYGHSSGDNLTIDEDYDN